MTTTHGSDEDMVGLAAMAGETMHTWLRDLEGFAGLLVLSNAETGTTQVLTVWESREVAERHQAARTRLREKITETVSVEVQELQSYDVAFAALPEQIVLNCSNGCLQLSQ